MAPFLFSPRLQHSSRLASYSGGGENGTAAAHEDSDTAGVGADIHDSHDSVIGHAVDAALTDLSGADHEVRLSI